MWLCPSEHCTDSSSFLDFSQLLSLALTTGEVNVFTALLHTHLQFTAYCIVYPCSFVVVCVVICLLVAENPQLKFLLSFCLSLIEKQPFHSPATSTATALWGITKRKMSHSTFVSEASLRYFYAYPSSFSTTCFLLPFISCRAWVVSKKYWKGHSCNVPEYWQQQHRCCMS